MPEVLGHRSDVNWRSGSARKLTSPFGPPIILTHILVTFGVSCRGDCYIQTEGAADRSAIPVWEFPIDRPNARASTSPGPETGRPRNPLQR